MAPPNSPRLRPVLIVLCAAACTKAAPAPVPEGAPGPAAAGVPETVTVRDPEQARRIGMLELQILAKDVQIDALSKQVDDARQEVVRAMAKLRTLATRAEAASGMAEAEIAVQTLRSRADRGSPELAQAEQLLQMSSTEFNSENYGGALYLANQAKGAAKVGEERVAGAQRLAPRGGETAFAVPVPLRVASRSNVREGPGTNFRVLFTLEGGTLVLGHSFANDWVRVVDDDGRAGWITRGLVTAR